MRHYFNLQSNTPTRIHLVGCGGTGSHLATRLVSLNTALLAFGHPGIHVVMFDPDIVSESNVGRQMFFTQDIGLSKVSVLVTRINQCTGFNWESQAQRYPDTRSQEPKILITAVDNAVSRVQIGRSLRSNYETRYWLDCGNMQRSGQVVLGAFGRGKQPKIKKKKTINRLPTVLDLYPELKKGEPEIDQGPSCSLPEALEHQDLFINQFMALEASEMLWKAFRFGYLEYSVAYINLEPRSSGILPINPEIWARFGYQVGKRSKKQQAH